MEHDRNNHFNWSQERWQRINTLVHDEAARIQVARRVLTLFGNLEAYMDSVASHQVNPGSPFCIQAGGHPVLVEISLESQLRINNSNTAVERQS